MLEDRLRVPKSQMQVTTSLVLSAHALACLIAGPLTGYLADRAPTRRFSLIASLGVEMIGTVIIMVAPTGMASLLLPRENLADLFLYLGSPGPCPGTNCRRSGRKLCLARRARNCGEEIDLCPVPEDNLRSPC